jgi:hypothetical protein
MRVASKSFGRREEKEREEDSQQAAMDMDTDPSELLSPDEEEGGVEASANRAPETFPLFSPIVEVSGHAEMKRNLTCTITGGGFPSVGCRNYPVNTGERY